MRVDPAARLLLAGSSCLVLLLGTAADAAASNVCLGQTAPAWSSAGTDGPSTANEPSRNGPAGDVRAADEIGTGDESWVGGLSGLSFVPDIAVPSQREEHPPPDVYFWCSGGDEDGCFPHRVPPQNAPTWQTRPPLLDAASPKVPQLPDSAMNLSVGGIRMLGPKPGFAFPLDRPPRG